MVDISTITPPTHADLEFSKRSLEVIRSVVQGKEELEKMNFESENKVNSLLEEIIVLIEELKHE